NNLRLTSTGGAVTETTGAVTANGLIVRAGTDIDMQSANQVTTLAAKATQGIAFNDTPALTIGAVTVTPPSLNDTLAGVSAGGGSALGGGGARGAGGQRRGGPQHP